MNAIAFCLDLILASLLLAALFVGLRLDRKLKVLKDSQSGFANAVAELDAAIVKAQDGLSALKATAVQAETAIADRIQDARGMTARLDQQSAAAKTAADKLERLLGGILRAPPAKAAIRRIWRCATGSGAKPRRAGSLRSLAKPSRVSRRWVQDVWIRAFAGMSE